MTTEIKSIYQKLATIYQELDPIQKTGTNKDQNYKYIEQSYVVAEIRKLLAEHGVLLLTNILSCEEQPNPGGKGTKAMIVMAFKLVNADKPDDFIEFPYWPSSAVDYSDKGINKATTMGQKYFLIRQFLISDADPDAETPAVDTTEKKTYQKRPVDTSTGEVKERSIDWQNLRDGYSAATTMSAIEAIDAGLKALNLPASSEKTALWKHREACAARIQEVTKAERAGK